MKTATNKKIIKTNLDDIEFLYYILIFLCVFGMTKGLNINNILHVTYFGFLLVSLAIMLKVHIMKNI